MCKYYLSCQSRFYNIYINIVKLYSESRNSFIYTEKTRKKFIYNPKSKHILPQNIEYVKYKDRSENFLWKIKEEQLRKYYSQEEIDEYKKYYLEIYYQEIKEFSKALYNRAKLICKN